MVCGFQAYIRVVRPAQSDRQTAGRGETAPMSDRSGHARSGGVTLVEMIVALVVMSIIFAAVFPLFRTVQTNWDAKAGAAECVQNGRILIDHIHFNLSEAMRITAVSPSIQHTGYIQFEDNEHRILRYDIDAASGYVRFGLVGQPANLGGPVSRLQFVCYDANNLTAPITDVNKIRYVKVSTTVNNFAKVGQDKTFETRVYLRANGLPLFVKVDIGAQDQPVYEGFTGWSVGNDQGSFSERTLAIGGIVFRLRTGLSGNLGFRFRQGGPLGRDFAYPVNYDPVNIDDNKLVLTIENLPEGNYFFKGWHNIFWLQDEPGRLVDPQAIDVEVSGAVHAHTDDLFVRQTTSPYDKPGSLGESNVSFTKAGEGDVIITFTPK